MNSLKLFLLPVAFLYGMGVRFRNFLFNAKILRSVSFDLPVISVGNLSVGGTGKTPHVEYIIRLLQDAHELVTLSRGYGRKSKGFVEASGDTDVHRIGDEPMQYYRKFSKIRVFVSENRRKGIRSILAAYPNTEAIILDDAYQHRYVKPGLNILLTDYLNTYPTDYLLPAGTLREPVSEAARADLIVVTKSPRVLSPITRRSLEDALKPLPRQKIFYSYLTYGDFLPVKEGEEKINAGEKFSTILLVAGIANVYPLQEYLRDYCFELETHTFPDHYQYTLNDLKKIQANFNDIYSRNKLLVTTEKDAMRFRLPEFQEILNELKLYYIPVKVVFHKTGGVNFDEIILNYVRKN